MWKNGANSFMKKDINFHCKEKIFPESVNFQSFWIYTNTHANLLFVFLFFDALFQQMYVNSRNTLIIPIFDDEMG